MTRDRLMIELFLATGLRVSEMAALTLASLRFSARPPRLTVTGSVHDPDCTKNCRPRNVPAPEAAQTVRLAASRVDTPELIKTVATLDGMAPRIPWPLRPPVITT